MKNILVVGGGGGLGRALVAELLAQGKSVAVAGRTNPNEPRLHAFHPVDASTVDWAEFLPTTAPLDGVIFVAGAGSFGHTDKIPLAEAKTLFDLNFWACTQAALAAGKYWRAQKMPGRFLAVLSIAGKRAVPWESYYAASKAATARFLECLQFEYVDEPIAFIPAFPGLLQTPFRDNVRWHGMTPTAAGAGADLAATARELIRLLQGKRRQRVLGWRERVIDLADRLWPGLYDRMVLRGRVRKARE